MGLLALSLLLVILPSCLLSVNARRNLLWNNEPPPDPFASWIAEDEEYHDNVQKVTSLDQFKPPRPGCVVNLIAEHFSTCLWCDQMATKLYEMLQSNYVPIVEYTMKHLLSSNFVWNQNYKGTCFVNWLIVDNFEGLKKIFNPAQLKKIRTKDWFIFVKVSSFFK